MRKCRSPSPPVVRQRPAPSRTPWSAMALAMALSACAGLPENPTDAKIKTAAGDRSLEFFRAPESAWPLDDWWRAYGDAQLDQLIAEGLRDAPDLRNAAARFAKAQAVAETAGATLWPSVNATAQITTDKQSYNQFIPPAFIPKGYRDSALAQLNFSYEFDFWGKNRAALE